MEQISQNCGEWLPGQVQEIFRSTFGTSLIIADVKRNHISSGANPDSCAGIGGRGDLARFCVQGERRTDLSHGAGYRVQFLHNNSKNAAMNSQHRQHIQTGYSQNARHARDTPAMPSFASWPRTSSVISSLQSAAVIVVAPDAQNLACLDLRGTRDDLFPVEPRYSARGTADADEFRFLYDAEGRRIYPRVNMHSIPVENRDRPRDLVHEYAGLIEGGPSVLPSPAQLLHAHDLEHGSAGSIEGTPSILHSTAQLFPFSGTPKATV